GRRRHLHGDGAGNPGQHHPHHHRRDRRGGRGQPAVGGALGHRHPDRVGVDHHDSDERKHRGDRVCNPEIGHGQSGVAITGIPEGASFSPFAIPTTSSSFFYQPSTPPPPPAAPLPQV